MVGREFIPIKISRGRNRVADHLANHGRTDHSTACWLRRGHPCIAELLSADCNSIFLGVKCIIGPRTISEVSCRSLNYIGDATYVHTYCTSKTFEDLDDTFHSMRT